MKKNLLITFSGGRTSAFMARFIQVNPAYQDYNKIYIFANTGKEHENTLKFINQCDKEWGLGIVWLEADVVHEKRKGTKYKVVTFETASRNGEPFQEVIKKYGLPSKLYRHCTRELKEVPIHKFAKEHFGSKDYKTALGIRADEQHRISSNPAYIYPLDVLQLDEKFIRKWWDKQSFDLELKDYQGNCDLCFLKSVRKKLTILTETPNLSEWWDKQEKENYREYQDKFDVYRDLTIEQLVEKAKQPFNKARDLHELREQQNSLFDLDLDVEFDCYCKNT